jgi:hypothetical protein
MKPGPTLRSLLALLLIGAAPVAALAGPNDGCLKCHTDPTVKRESGAPMQLTDAEKFRVSVHGGKKGKCVECHEDAESEDGKDHARKLKPVDCNSCHDDAVAQYKDTVHAKARASGNTIAATCGDCHGNLHEVLPSSNPKSRTNYANIEASCGSCHGNDKVVEKGHLPGGNVQAKYHDSIHGRLMHDGVSTNARAPTCTSCHGAHSILGHKEKGSKVSFANIPETCGGCHQRAHVVYDQGKHGSLQHKGDKTAPVCSDCHSAHSIQRASQDAWRVAVVGQCGNCHEDYVQSYRKTYHGKVTNLGFADMATCASCHGSHDIRPASDPLSKVAGVNRVETCRQCHKQASAKFASWDPHPRPTDKSRDPVLYWANLGMNVLLAGVFIFFGLHTVLWAYRSIGDALKRRRGG